MSLETARDGGLVPSSVGSPTDNLWSDFLADREQRLNQATTTQRLNSLLAEMDLNIANLSNDTKQSDRLTRLQEIRAAMVRRRQILSDAGTGRSQYQFNTTMNEKNLFNTSKTR